MGSTFHQLCPRYSVILTPTAPTAIRLWETFTFFYHLTFQCVLYLNLPEQIFQMALLLHKENNCAKLFWNPCINVQAMAQTNPDGRMHKERTYTELKL